MIDEQALADAGRGVNLDAGESAREHRDRAWQQRHPGGVQRMCHSVAQQRVDPGPRREDLRGRHSARGGITFFGRAHVAPQLASDPRECAEADHHHSVAACAYGAKNACET